MSHFQRHPMRGTLPSPACVPLPRLVLFVQNLSYVVAQACSGTAFQDIQTSTSQEGERREILKKTPKQQNSFHPTYCLCGFGPRRRRIYLCLRQAPTRRRRQEVRRSQGPVEHAQGKEKEWSRRFGHGCCRRWSCKPQQVLPLRVSGATHPVLGA